MLSPDTICPITGEHCVCVPQAGSRDGDFEPLSRPRATTITPGEDLNARKLPTVFKWENPEATDVYISGSYDNWKGKLPMVKR